jgi:hypothetical protein
VDYNARVPRSWCSAPQNAPPRAPRRRRWERRALDRRDRDDGCGLRHQWCRAPARLADDPDVRMGAPLLDRLDCGRAKPAIPEESAATSPTITANSRRICVCSRRHSTPPAPSLGSASPTCPEAWADSGGPTSSSRACRSRIATGSACGTTPGTRRPEAPCLNRSPRSSEAVRKRSGFTRI